jgi:hypothetical protein
MIAFAAFLIVKLPEPLFGDAKKVGCMNSASGLVNATVPLTLAELLELVWKKKSELAFTVTPVGPTVTSVVALAEASTGMTELVLCEAVLDVMMTSGGLSLTPGDVNPNRADDCACSTPESQMMPPRDARGDRLIKPAANTTSRRIPCRTAHLRLGAKRNRFQAYEAATAGRNRKVRFIVNGATSGDHTARGWHHSNMRDRNAGWRGEESSRFCAKQNDLGQGPEVANAVVSMRQDSYAGECATSSVRTWTLRPWNSTLPSLSAKIV